MFRTFLVLVVLAATCSGAALAGNSRDTSGARQANLKFASLTRAKAAGYGELLDAKKIACIAMPGTGAMGIHYVKGTLVGDATVNALKPEALVYEPQADGSAKLVALEYVVFKAPWDAAHANDPANFPEMPTLFGQDFMEVPAVPGNNGNTIFDIPPFYMLHVWIWNSNPSGLFFPWNPSVSCAGASAAAGSTVAAASASATLTAADVARYACRVRGATA